MDPDIHFTTEETRTDGSIPLLDTLVMPQPDNFLIITRYRKPTHRDLYLQWDSDHNLAVKFSVVNPLKYRARTVCSYTQLLKEEEDHLKQTLQRCKYPVWTLNRANIKHNKTKTHQRFKQHQEQPRFQKQQAIHSDALH